MTEQRFSFDQVAELYDKVRPGYPKALLGILVAEAGVNSAARVLEVGCGTGQATSGLAESGCEIVCLEPGESMFRVAQRNAERFDRVRILRQTFEEWPVEESSFDLVISAQAFHWVDPAVRFPKAAQALREGGALALMGNVSLPTADPVWTDVGRAYADCAPAIAGPSPTHWYAADGPIPDLVAASKRFAEVRHHCVAWSLAYSSEDYVGLMATHSDHRLLESGQREALLAAIRRAIDSHGGAIEMRYDTHLYLARCL